MVSMILVYFIFQVLCTNGNMSLFVRFQRYFSSFYYPELIYKEEASENKQKIYDSNSQVIWAIYLWKFEITIEKWALDEWVVFKRGNLQINKCPVICCYPGTKDLAVWPVISVFSVHKRARTYESCGSRSLGLSLTCKLTPSVFRTAVSLFSIKKQRFIFGVS